MAISVIDSMVGGESTQAAWDFLSSANPANVVPDTGEDEGDSFAEELEMDRGEGEEEIPADSDDSDDDTSHSDASSEDAVPDEDAAAPLDPNALDNALQALREREAIIEQQQQQLNHILSRLNDTALDKTWDDLTEKEREPYEAKAARWNLDPAYIHYHAAEEQRVNQATAARAAIQAVSDYADNHPDSAEYGDHFARMLQSSPAARAQLQMAALLPLSDIFQASCAAIDGMYAKLARAGDAKKAEVAKRAAEAAAQQKTQVVEKAKRRAGGIGTNAASPSGTKETKPDNAAERIVSSAKASWMKSLLG